MSRVMISRVVLCHIQVCIRVCVCCMFPKGLGLHIDPTCRARTNYVPLSPLSLAPANYAGSWTQTCQPMGFDGRVMVAMCSCLGSVFTDNVHAFQADGCRSALPGMISTFSLDTYDFLTASVEQVRAWGMVMNPCNKSTGSVP